MSPQFPLLMLLSQITRIHEDDAWVTGLVKQAPSYWAKYESADLDLIKFYKYNRSLFICQWQSAYASACVCVTDCVYVCIHVAANTEIKHIITIAEEQKSILCDSNICSITMLVTHLFVGTSLGKQSSLFSVSLMVPCHHACYHVSLCTLLTHM